MNATRNMMAAISVTMPSGSFGSSSLWASSFLSQLLFRGLVATMDGLNKLLLRTWFGATNWKQQTH